MDFNNKTSIEIRLIMKEQGWNSEDRLSDVGWGGKVGYSIWFRRYNWHGRNTISLTGHGVCFHRHTSNLGQIDHITRICAEQCLKAYKDYTDCIPYQNVYNETTKDIMVEDWNDVRVLLKGSKREYKDKI
ncbi:hypothetical protein [Clostridium botulinum]|uniref:hypothetical protein n=1 Tax=Clostridium botulinum TaxID=1491 RepID=UPI0007734CFA|nr:hypothetical protein [Clostridium botulinum]